jgi:hypothetical protein
MNNTLPANGYYFLSVPGAGKANSLYENTKDLFDDDPRGVLIRRTIISDPEELDRAIDELIIAFQQHGHIYNLFVDAHGGVSKDGLFFLEVLDPMTEKKEWIEGPQLLDQFRRLNFVYGNRLCVFLNSCEGAKIQNTEIYFTTQEGFPWRRLVAPLPKIGIMDAFTNYTEYFSRVRNNKSDEFVEQIGIDFITDCQLIVEDNLMLLLKRVNEFVKQIDKPNMIGQQLREIPKEELNGDLLVTPENKRKMRSFLYNLVLQAFYFRNFLNMTNDPEYLKSIGHYEFIEMTRSLEFECRKKYVRKELVAVNIDELLPKLNQ